MCSDYSVNQVYNFLIQINLVSINYTFEGIKSAY